MRGIKNQLFPYAIVVMLSYIGFALPLPILPVLFLKSQNALLPPDTTLATKTILLGLVLTAFPLGQFIGSPILGRLSDTHGRKRVILLTLGGTVAGYILAGLGIVHKNISLLFSGLFFCGLCEGNTSIAQSAIADISPREERGKYFGWLNFFITAGFVIGPLVGGILSNPVWLPNATLATPFWAGGLLTLGGIALLAWKGRETMHRKSEEPLSFFSSFKTLMKTPKLKLFYVANFFLSLGLYYFYRFVGVYLEQRFHFTATKLGYFLAYDALAFATALFLLIPYFEKRFTAKKNTTVFSFAMGIAVIIFTLPSNPLNLYWAFILVGFSLALALTYSSLMVSLAVEERLQGQAMGVLVSIQMLAQVLTSASGGFLAAYLPSLPILIGGSMCFVCALLLKLSREAPELPQTVESNDLE